MYLLNNVFFQILEEYGPHPVSICGCNWCPHQACRFLKQRHHHIHLLLKKALLKEDAISRMELTRDLMTILLAAKKDL